MTTTITITINLALIVGAFGFGLTVGLFLGRTAAGWYHSKKECRECMRRLVEYGFHVDGKEYVVKEAR